MHEYNKKRLPRWLVVENPPVSAGDAGDVGSVPW